MLVSVWVEANSAVAIAPLPRLRLGHITGGYPASPSATPKFATLTLRKLHISPEHYLKSHLGSEVA